MSACFLYSQKKPSKRTSKKSCSKGIIYWIILLFFASRYFFKTYKKWRLIRKIQLLLTVKSGLNIKNRYKQLFTLWKKCVLRGWKWDLRENHRKFQKNQLNFNKIKVKFKKIKLFSKIKSSEKFFPNFLRKTGGFSKLFFGTLRPLFTPLQITLYMSVIYAAPRGDTYVFKGRKYFGAFFYYYFFFFDILHYFDVYFLPFLT